MKYLPKDPLLAIAKAGTIIARILLVIGMIAIGIAMAAIALFAAGWVPDEVVIEMGSGLSSAPMWLAALALLAGLVALGLVYDFIARLAAIIDSVGIGDPFIMANAARLTRMAWLALGVQVASFAAMLLGNWAEQSTPDGQIELNSEFSFTGLFLAVILFILARVFRKGAEMRAELEGTV